MRFPIPMFDYHQQLEAPQNQDCGATWLQFHAVSFRPQLCSLGFPWVEVVWDTILRRFGFHPTHGLRGKKMRPEVWPCAVSFSLRCWISQYITTYCGWKKSCTTSDGWNPINTGIDHLPTGAGFLPSTVSQSSATCHFFQWTHIQHISQLNASGPDLMRLRRDKRQGIGGAIASWIWSQQWWRMLWRIPNDWPFFYGWEFLSNLYGIM
jgi:hypothetical protein